MKKVFFFLLSISLILNYSFAQRKLSDIPIDPASPEALLLTDDVPEIFDGIWEGNDRYIMFQEKSELKDIVKDEVELKEDNYIWIYLKMFYGWYVDRSAEKYTKKNSPEKYDSNDVVFRDIQNIKIQFKKLLDIDECNAYEIIITYPKQKEKTVIPVAVIDGELYLDFAIRADYKTYSPEGKSSPLIGSWSSVAHVSGIKVSKPITDTNLYSLFITDSRIYSIRYWKTDMDFNPAMAFFSDGDNKFEVPKHISSAGNVYTCVTGRSVTIRNVELKKNLNINDFKIDSQKMVLATGTPYLKRISEHCSFDDMMNIVAVSNARKAPEQDPPFPPFKLDWEPEDIKSLEIQRKILEAVHRRHKEFCEKYPFKLRMY
ncbi:MAG: hypothetical protein J6Y36_04895 [Treponema sp.]|nr:hypothetical protein [Treponema sp.]